MVDSAGTRRRRSGCLYSSLRDTTHARASDPCSTHCGTRYQSPGVVLVVGCFVRRFVSRIILGGIVSRVFVVGG